MSTTLVIRPTDFKHYKKETGTLKKLLELLPDAINDAFGDEDVIITITAGAKPSVVDPLTPEQIKVISTKISDCELSVRSINALERFGVLTVAAVLFMTEVDLLKMPNFSTKSLKGVRDYLDEHKLWDHGARPKIDAYIIEKFGIDPATLSTLRTRLCDGDYPKFTTVEKSILGKCKMHTLAGAVCWDEWSILAILQECHEYHWVRATFEPYELMEKIRRVVQEYGFTIGTPELQMLRPWIAM